MCFILILCRIDVANADIYMYRDDNGVLHLGNRSEAKVRGTLFMRESPRFSDPNHKNAERMKKLVESVARQHAVDPALAMAIAHAESSFRPDAVSPKGAVGIMQLMPDTARQLNVKDIYRPEDNIDGGIRHLKKLLGMFPEDIRLAVAAYNAGENRVMESGRIPNITETREYVDRVIRFYNQYRDRLSGSSGSFAGTADSGDTSGSGKARVLPAGPPVTKVIRGDGTIVLSNM